MYILDNFGVADTFFTSKECKNIIAEIEDELHYGDSLYPIEQYGKCIAPTIKFIIKDTAYYQKIYYKDFAIESIATRDSVNKEFRGKIIDDCVKQNSSPDGSDTAHFRNLCQRATNKLLRRQKARPHKQGDELPIILAKPSDKKLTKECMSMLDEFGVADTYFTSKACKSIILEIEDELHYGDSLYPIELYNGCVTFLKDNHGITDTVTIQKVCPKVAEVMVNERDSLEKESRKKLMDLCLMLKFSFGASDDSAHYRKICERSTNKSLRLQKARPHRQ